METEQLQPEQLQPERDISGLEVVYLYMRSIPGNIFYNLNMTSGVIKCNMNPCHNYVVVVQERDRCSFLVCADTRAELAQLRFSFSLCDPDWCGELYKFLLTHVVVSR